MRKITSFLSILVTVLALGLFGSIFGSTNCKTLRAETPPGTIFKFEAKSKPATGYAVGQSTRKEIVGERAANLKPVAFQSDAQTANTRIFTFKTNSVRRTAFLTAGKPPNYSRTKPEIIRRA